MAGVTSDDGARARLRIADQLAELERLRAWQSLLARVCLVASARIAREDTSPKTLFTIPAGFEAHSIVIHGEIGSNAGTSAVVDVGRPGQPGAFVAAHSVLGAAGVGQRFPEARRLGVVAGADIEVTGRYVEVGAAATAGGPWTVTVSYSKAGG